MREQSTWHRDQALAWLAAHPAEWPRLFGQKFLMLWNLQITPFEVPPLAATSEAAFIDEAVYSYETARLPAGARRARAVLHAPVDPGAGGAESWRPGAGSGSDRC